MPFLSLSFFENCFACDVKSHIYGYNDAFALNVGVCKTPLNLLLFLILLYIHLLTHHFQSEKKEYS